MCNIKKDIDELMEKAESARNFLSGSTKKEDKHNYLYLKEKHSIFTSDLYGFYRALEIMKEKIDGNAQSK